MKKPKILYLVTEDWYFCSHRLPIAREAMRRGYDVLVATRVDRHGEQILAEGFKLIPLNMQRNSTNPLTEVAAIRDIITIYRLEKPHIVHHVAMKPVIYGSIAAWIVKVPHVVNALAGLGYVFISDNMKARLLRPIISFCLGLVLNRKGSNLILQNKDDIDLFLEERLIKNGMIRLIRGSGVDTELFHPNSAQASLPTILLASRMLWDKGIGEFIEAACILTKREINARFVLVGDEDLGNPNSIPHGLLHEWANQGVVEWWGKRDDMPDVLEKATVFCLPSYREGLPKVLLEAASCGLPIITTDVPGCREIVRQGENGLLVPMKNVFALADAIQYLIENPEIGIQMGRRGREIAVTEFGVEKVVAETMAVYEEVLTK